MISPYSDLSNVKELERQIEIGKVDVGFMSLTLNVNCSTMARGCHDIAGWLSNLTDSTISQLKLTAISEMANQDILMKQLIISVEAQIYLNTTVQRSITNGIAPSYDSGLITIILQCRPFGGAFIVRERNRALWNNSSSRRLKAGNCWARLSLSHRVFAQLVPCFDGSDVRVHVMGNMAS